MANYNGLKITNVNFRPWNRGSSSLVAFADVELNDTVTLSGFKVIRRKDGGLFAAPPSTEKMVEGEKRYYDQVLFPKSWREERKNPFCDEIVAAYKESTGTSGSSAGGDETPEIPF